MAMFWDADKGKCKKHSGDCPLEKMTDAEFEDEAERVWEYARRVGRIPESARDHIAPSCESCLVSFLTQRAAQAEASRRGIRKQKWDEDFNEIEAKSDVENMDADETEYARRFGVTKRGTEVTGLRGTIRFTEQGKDEEDK
jgi:hypothetical protein